jgi:hypothetical protein
MSQALIQQLLDILLISEFNDIHCYDSLFMKKVENRKRLIDLFRQTIDEMKANVPYWLKYFRGNWRKIKPSETASIVAQQVTIDGLKKNLDAIVLKRENYNNDSRKYIQELCNKMKDEDDKCQRSPDCKNLLICHLKKCANTPPCTFENIAYECRFTDNGRCDHFNAIKEAKRELEEYEYYDNEYDWKYHDALYSYNTELGIQKYGSKDAYFAKIYDDDYYDI